MEFLESLNSELIEQNIITMITWDLTDLQACIDMLIIVMNNKLNDKTKLIVLFCPIYVNF